MSVKYITISQAEQSKDTSVWALNTSGGNGASKGIVNITIVEGNGRSTVVRVPVTFIPIDLTTQATKTALLMSPDFRRLVSAKIISLISTDDAEDMMNNDRARAEHNRLLNIDNTHAVTEAQMSSEVQSMHAEASGKIGGFAMNIAHSDGEEDSIVSNLQNNASVLSKEELQYIVNNSTFHKVKAAAAEFIVK